MTKNVYTFSLKIIFTCWIRLKTAKLLATVKQLIRNNSVCCLKNQVIFFHRVHIQIGWTTPSPFSFLLAF